MHTLADFSKLLTEAHAARKITINDLAERTGLSRKSVSQILAGQTAPKITNAMALANELGLELVLLPKGAAGSIAAAPQAERKVLSDVERRLDLKNRTSIRRG
jgi:transcriptional regulator with XRE-family HTH domain